VSILEKVLMSSQRLKDNTEDLEGCPLREKQKNGSLLSVQLVTAIYNFITVLYSISDGCFTDLWIMFVFFPQRKLYYG
jgi:hypothetical protein